MKRYVIGGYEGDQLDSLVAALVRDAESAPEGVARLREICHAVLATLPPACNCGFGAEPWHVGGRSGRCRLFSPAPAGEAQPDKTEEQL